jgi:hypothetical protein
MATANTEPRPLPHPSPHSSRLPPAISSNWDLSKMCWADWILSALPAVQEGLAFLLSRVLSNAVDFEF